jgi:DoxX-like family
MGVALWVVQVLLAAGFLVSGATKRSQPGEKLIENDAWMEDFSQPTVRVIGALEVWGGRGRAAGIDGDPALADALGGPRSGPDNAGSRPHAPQTHGAQQQRRARGAAHPGRLRDVRAVLRPAGLSSRFVGRDG